MMIRIVLHSFMLTMLLTSSAYAQSHPCDLPPQSGPQTVNVNATFTLRWCHSGKDAAGLPVNVTGWKLIRNGAAAIDITATPTTTKNAAGLTGYSVTRSEPTVGTMIYQLYGINGSIDGSKASITFTVQAVDGPLVAPSNLRVVVFVLIVQIVIIFDFINVRHQVPPWWRALWRALWRA